jgi:hypothetical protein
MSHLIQKPHLNIQGNMILSYFILCQTLTRSQLTTLTSPWRTNRPFNTSLIQA